jgi:hypothetical protein
MPEGLPASPRVEDGPEQQEIVARANERFPIRCGVCSACRQPWLRQVGASPALGTYFAILSLFTKQNNHASCMYCRAL